MIVTFAGVTNAGCTFADWSLHFLAGKDQHYNVVEQQWIPLVTNPLGPVNAHKHTKNHPCGFDFVKQAINQFEVINSADMLSAYIYCEDFYAVAQALNLNCHRDWPRIEQYLEKDLAKSWQYCNDHGSKNILIGDTQNLLLQTWLTRSTSTSALGDFIRIFFPDYNDKAAIWSRREQLALSIRPFDKSIVTRQIDRTITHCYIECQQWFYDGKESMKEIFEYLGLTIDPVRLEQWRPVYQQWQKIVQPRTDFAAKLKHIVSAIVNGWYYEIDLSFEQEVVVLHCLIYQHGLNLKNWQLSKFPSNTQDLHKLLESNIHTVSNIY